MGKPIFFVICLTPLLFSTVTLPVAAEGGSYYSGDPGMIPDQNEQSKVDEEKGEEKKDAHALVLEAKQLVREMRAEGELNNALQRAKGVFLVPDFGRAAAVVGARGGQGVMLAKENGEWSSPAFYNFGAISAGAQIGVDAGQIALLLMTDEAVESFKQENNFSLNAAAGLTIIDWSGMGEESWGKGDVVVWSDVEGLFAGASINISNINADGDANRSYYDRAVQLDDIIEGEVESPMGNPVAQVLP